MTYAEVDFASGSTNAPEPSAAVEARTVLGNGHVRRQSDVSQTTKTISATAATPTESYAVIDFKKTAAISAINTTAPVEDESGRKTRHDSTIDFQY